MTTLTRITKHNHNLVAHANRSMLVKVYACTTRLCFWFFSVFAHQWYRL